jgi:iron-sulfur cluster assembly 2
MVKDSNPNLALRITVESGGCHGFQYLMSLTTLSPFSQPSTSSSSIPEEDGAPALNTSPADPSTVPTGLPTSSSPKSFSSSNDCPEAQVDEDDTVFKATDGSEAKVVMDGPSLELLKGSKIDYTMELIGSQFKIVDNPLATSSCGCGTSFDIKA